MMKMKKIIAVVIILNIFISQKIFAKDPGTTSAQFLKLGVGARAISMGKAYASLANDVNSIYWNPAGIKSLYTVQISAMHAIWIENIYYSNIAFSKSIFSGQAAMGIKYLSSGKIKSYDNNGTEVGNYSAYDLAVTIGYARDIKTLSTGLSIKLLNSKIDDEMALGWGIDAGIQGGYHLFQKRIRYGIALKNLGIGLKFNKIRDPLPAVLCTGLSSAFLNNTILASFDINIPFDNSLYSAFGIEYKKDIGQISLKLRGGFNTKNLSDLDFVSSLSAGLGISYDSWNIDYAWVPLWEFNSTHRLSVTRNF